MRYDPHAQRLAFRGDYVPKTAYQGTLRRGRKWFDLFHAGERNVVMIGGRKGAPFGTATVFSAMLSPLCHVGKEVLGECGFATELDALRHLRQVYGPSVTRDELISVIFFQPEGGEAECAA